MHATARPRIIPALGALLTTLLVVALSLGTTTPASAAAGTITGHVDLGVVGTRAGQGEVRVSLTPYTSPANPIETLTDEEGAYRFDGLGPGAYRLVFTYLGTGDFATRSAPVVASAGTHDFLVPRGALLSGDLDLDVVGTPAADVLVSLIAPGGISEINTTTDADGHFDFGRVPIGAQRLFFSVPQWGGRQVQYFQGADALATSTETALSTITVDSDQVLHAIVSSGKGITGIARDTAGHPVPGIHVTLFDGPTPLNTTTTDATGRYWFRSLRGWGATYFLRFSSDLLDDGRPAYSEVGWPNSASWDPSWVAVAAKPIDLEDGFDIVLHEYSEMTATIDGPGAVDALATMELIRWDEDLDDWQGFGMTWPDAGEAHFENLLPGRYLLIVTRSDPRFEPVYATGYVDEGTSTAFSLWLKNPTTAQLLTFADVPPTHPFSSEIEWLYRAGITRGTVEADGTRNYYPAQGISRAAMAAFLYRAAGEPEFAPPSTPSFADVPIGSPFYAEIEWMKSTGITTGSRFGEALLYQPNADVSRRDMAAFLYRADGSPTFGAPHTAPFTDTPLGSQFVREIAWLKSEHISTGNADGSFSPAAPVHRAAMAAFLSRMLTR